MIGPRERLEAQGPAALSDAELLALLLSTGRPGASVLAVAAELVAAYPGRTLPDASIEELCKISGVGRAKASRLAAAWELGRRALGPTVGRPNVRTAADAFRAVAPLIGSMASEHVLALLLDARCGLIASATVAIGGHAGVEVHAREVFREAIRRGASSVILAHNHPSTDLTPSRDDQETTKRLLQVSEIVGIPLVDHLIVGGGRYVSLRATSGLWESQGDLTSAIGRSPVKGRI